MKDVYGRLSPGRLIARERDAVTGRLTARREDKRQDSDRSTQPSSGGDAVFARSTRAWWAAGAAAAVVALFVAGAVAVAGRGPDDRSVAVRSAAADSGGTSGPVAPSSGAPPVPPASAIALEYSGGARTRYECSDVTGGGSCAHIDASFDPLSVRCTADGCTLYFFGKSAPLGSSLTLTGDVPAKLGCQPTRWSIQLKPVGGAVTEGIRHPERLVGTASAARPAEQFPGVNCLGADEAYRYEAVPS